MDGSLLKKLQLKPGQKMAVLNAPEGYVEGLAKVLKDIEMVVKAGGKSDAVLAFVKDRADAKRLTPKAISAIKPDGLLWLAYPKGTSKIKTDVNRDTLWKVVEPTGWEGVRLIAMDETWSVMRFRPAEKVKAPKK